MTDQLNNIYDRVERIVGKPNLAILLREIVDYVKQEEKQNKTGGIGGLGLKAFCVVKKKGKVYLDIVDGNELIINMGNQSHYDQLPIDDFSSVMYLGAYFELYLTAISDSKSTRYEHFRWLMRPKADRYTYMKI